MTSQPTNPLPASFLSNNEAWRPSWHNAATMAQIRRSGNTPFTPTMIITCMDPRCDPVQFLGTNPETGDKMLFASIRNPGGRITPDTMRSVLTVRSLAMNSTGGSLVIVHHTDCGMTHLTDEGIAADALKRTPSEEERIKAIDYGCFTSEDFEETIRVDMRKLRAEKYTEGMDVLGFAFITETGELKQIFA